MRQIFPSFVILPNFDGSKIQFDYGRVFLSFVFSHFLNSTFVIYSDDDSASSIDNEESRRKRQKCNDNQHSSTRFAPMHYVSLWKDRSHKDHVLVAMSLPCGLLYGGLDGKVHSSISNCGKKLIVQMNWPNLLFDTKALEKVMLREPGFDERKWGVLNLTQSAELEIKKLRGALGITSHQAITSETIIKLPVECYREIKMIVPLISETTGDAVLYMTAKVVTNEPEECTIPLICRVVDSDEESETDPGLNYACTGKNKRKFG